MTHIIPHPMQLFSWLQNTILQVHIGMISDAYRHLKREVWTLFLHPYLSHGQLQSLVAS